MKATSLKPGALKKLLQERESSSSETSPRGNDSVLQITGIVPAIGETGLFPDGGFHLKVSDSSHSMYAALPQEQDDLVLNDELQLGQFIHVSLLEVSSPLPVLRGVKPLPGKHPCQGNPSDISSENFFAKKKATRLAQSSSVKGGISRRHTMDSTSTEILRELAKFRVSSMVEESEDSDTSRSSASSPVSRTRSLRRSWNCSTRIKDYRQSGTLIPRKLNPRVLRQQKDYNSDSSSQKTCKESGFLVGEGSVLPASLPLNLVKLGKEAMRQRDLAIVAAVEALQEAVSSERLIRCLMKYQDIQHHVIIDNFMNFLNEIQQARSAVQTLEKTTQKNSNTTKIAKELRKHAIAWITAAMTSETSPETDSEANSRISNSILRSTQRSNGETWMRGACPLVSADLAKSLHAECNKWFLTYIEKFLDGVITDSTDTAPENQIAGILLQIKKVDEWLEKMSMKEGSRESSREHGSSEAYERVRRKIYSVLLMHVDRAASALESMSATDEGSESYVE